MSLMSESRERSNQLTSAVVGMTEDITEKEAPKVEQEYIDTYAPSSLNISRLKLVPQNPCIRKTSKKGTQSENNGVKEKQAYMTMNSGSSICTMKTFISD